MHTPFRQLAALVLALCWIIGMGLLAGWIGALQGTIYAGSAVFLIWNPEFVGNFTGWTGRGYINRTTPAPVVRGIGWAMLTLPAWLTPLLLLLKACG
ncbi:MAG: hypothetical protein H6742_00860 [Alphaproteobacteria bacterium]|nr:hypothetical protein [Alphaproteobacteria bacterium]